MKECEKYVETGNLPDYQEQIFALDRLIEQMESGIRVLQNATQACLDSLQALHPEWKYRIIGWDKEYRIIKRKTGRVVFVNGKPLAYPLAHQALFRQETLEREAREKQKQKEQGKEAGKSAATPTSPAPKAPGKH